MTQIDKPLGNGIHTEWECIEQLEIIVTQLTSENCRVQSVINRIDASWQADEAFMEAVGNLIQGHPELFVDDLYQEVMKAKNRRFMDRLAFANSLLEGVKAAPVVEEEPEPDWVKSIQRKITEAGDKIEANEERRSQRFWIEFFCFFFLFLALVGSAFLFK